MLVSFTLGTLLVATTALADIANKSGYDQLKDALKLTAEQSSDKFASYTMDYSMAVKDNGKTVMSENKINKYDRSKGTSENSSSGLSMNGTKISYQNYMDKTTHIHSEDDTTYNVTEFTKERKQEAFPNPFKQDHADDIEKIADAVVGSLKDHVVVTVNLDGSKGLTGSLTDMQIPSLVNAVASFQLKQQFGNRFQDQDNNMPRLTKDVFVKDVKGIGKMNKDGVMESILGTAVLSGKDDKGTVHDITIEVLAKLSGINATTVTKPDLTGKTVVKNVDNNEGPDSEMSNPEKFVGKFSNDIVIEKDKKFVKVGQRFIDITQFDNKTVAGRYYEVYKPEFEEYDKNKFNFKFEGKKPEKKNYSGFDLTTESGSKGNIYLERQGKIHFNMNVQSDNSMFDPLFNPDLD